MAVVGKWRSWESGAHGHAYLSIKTIKEFSSRFQMELDASRAVLPSNMGMVPQSLPDHQLQFGCGPMIIIRVEAPIYLEISHCSY
jgi:hypothetical protein